MKGFLLFAVISLVLISAAAWALALYFDAPGESRAIWVTAVVAWVIQLFTFVIAKKSATTNVIAGWGVGAVLRMLSLGAYALVIVKAFDMPPTAPLFLFVFFFVTMLPEPLLLNV